VTPGTGPSLDHLTNAAEAEWLEGWTTGPTETERRILAEGSRAPDLRLRDHLGEERALSEYWSDGPALLVFWRHFGCNCGLARAARLRAEWPRYRDAGLNPVIVSQGEPVRAAAYRAEQDLPCPILCDPDHDAYRAYGIGQWSVERVLSAAPPEYWKHPRELGVSFQDGRRDDGLPPVDDPWRAVGEFVIGSDGTVRLSYAYQYCEDFPPPELLTTAALLA
jgi:peroxiredoxin